jgi:hypothetical protein
MAAIVRPAKLEAVVGSLLARGVGGNRGNNHGPVFVGSGFGEKGGLQLVYSSLPVAEAVHHEERNKRCENQNACHCHLLRAFVSGPRLTLRTTPRPNCRSFLG